MENTAIVEGLLFIAGDEGLELEQIAHALDLSESMTREVIEKLQKQYESNKRGLAILNYGQVYQMTTKKEHVEYYKKIMEQTNNSSLSQAALETLAIISYRQPITRIEIEEIRGVKSDSSIQNLVSKLLVQEVGRTDSPGRPILYGTTKEFLDHFGLRTLKELPPLSEQIDEMIEEEDTDLFFTKFQETISQN